MRGNPQWIIRRQERGNKPALYLGPWFQESPGWIEEVAAVIDAGGLSLR
jgi:hypothetical protein